MTAQPMQPKTSAVAAVSPTPVRQINTVVAIGSDFLTPAAITYNDASEPEALSSLLECYKLHRGLTPEQYASVDAQFTHLWNFIDGAGVSQGANTVDGKLVSVFLTSDGSELPDGKPKAPKVMPAGTYEIWVEGHPRSLGAVKVGEAPGETFKEACITYFKDDASFDLDRMFWRWGGLFDNETEARKNYG